MANPLLIAFNLLKTTMLLLLLLLCV